MTELNFSAQARRSAKDQLLRKQLLDLVHEEKEQFTQLANEFYAKNDRDDESSLDICREIVAIVNRITSTEGWKDSLFLRNIMKPLIDAQQEAQKVLDLLVIREEEAKNLELPPVTDDQQLVYISLFQADGYDFLRWGMQLRSIERYLVGRPVYNEEKDVLQLIRSKETTPSDAYIVCTVNKTDIQQDEWALKRKDANGQAVLALANNSVTADSIREFVHMNKRYRLQDSKLIAMD